MQKLATVLVFVSTVTTLGIPLNNAYNKGMKLIVEQNRSLDEAINIVLEETE